MPVHLLALEHAPRRRVHPPHRRRPLGRQLELHRQAAQPVLKVRPLRRQQGNSRAAMEVEVQDIGAAAEEE